MPAIFISHGPPAVLLMKGKTPDFLRKLGAMLPRPNGVICVSAHWEALHPRITAAPRPEIIYDFSGPPALFKMQYAVEGDPSLAEDAGERIRSAGFKISADPERGLDHGAWVPLKMMYPEGDIPVVQVSVQTEKDPGYHYKLGKALMPLREKGVLIMGSGGAVHNLDEADGYKIDSAPPDYVSAFDEWLEKAVTGGATNTLIDYAKTAPDPHRCHPFPAEHFLPFFVPLGAAGPGASGKKLHHDFMYGVLSMAAYLWL